MIPVGHERDKAIAEQLGLEYWERPPFGVTVLGVPPTHLGHVSTDPIAAFRMLEYGVGQKMWWYRVERDVPNNSWVEVYCVGSPSQGKANGSDFAATVCEAVLKVVTP